MLFQYGCRRVWPHTVLALATRRHGCSESRRCTHATKQCIAAVLQPKAGKAHLELRVVARRGLAQVQADGGQVGQGVGVLGVLLKRLQAEVGRAAGLCCLKAATRRHKHVALAHRLTKASGKGVTKKRGGVQALPAPPPTCSSSLSASSHRPMRIWQAARLLCSRTVQLNLSPSSCGPNGI